jgi:hypothetical protein
MEAEDCPLVASIAQMAGFPCRKDLCTPRTGNWRKTPSRTPALAF